MISRRSVLASLGVMLIATVDEAAGGAGIPGYGDSFPFLRTSDQQFYTTAHPAYQRSADGMSLFNFVHFREHGTSGRGPFNEPPFRVLKRFGDPKWLTKQQRWWLSKVDNAAPAKRPLPRQYAAGDMHDFTLDLAPRSWRKDGFFRLRTVESTAGRKWFVRMNGTALAPLPYIAKPLDHLYRAGLGEPTQHVCFTSCTAALKQGANTVAIAFQDVGPAALGYFDIVL